MFNKSTIIILLLSFFSLNCSEFEGLILESNSGHSAQMTVTQEEKISNEELIRLRLADSMALDLNFLDKIFKDEAKKKILQEKFGKSKDEIKNGKYVYIVRAGEEILSDDIDRVLLSIADTIKLFKAYSSDKAKDEYFEKISKSILG